MATQAVETASPSVVASMRPYRLYLWSMRLFFLLAVLSADAFVLDVIFELENVQRAPQPLWADIVSFLGFAWVLYWWTYRFALRVELTPDDRLIWSSALRRDEASLAAVLDIKHRWGATIIGYDGGRVFVPSLPGHFKRLDELSAELNRRRHRQALGPPLHIPDSRPWQWHRDHPMLATLLWVAWVELLLLFKPAIMGGEPYPPVVLVIAPVIAASAFALWLAALRRS